MVKKSNAYLLIICLILSFLLTNIIHIHAQTSDYPGFRVQGRHLYDKYGNQVILVGVNKMVIWTDRDGIPAFPEIAKTGANVVRIVWLTEGSAAELDKVITNAFNHQLIPMVDCHDSTGEWELLSRCVDYWVRPDILKVLKKHEAYLLINIANEAGKGIVPEWEFRAAYELAIKRMRYAGLHVPLIIDAQGFGQSIDDLQKNGPYLIKTDPDHNLMFSIHMWWPTAWRGSGVTNTIIDEIEESVEMELPLIVGEFASKAPGCACCIPYRTIIEQCHLHEIGYLPWSWGPGNGDCAEMDMTDDGLFDTLHGWGLEVAITGTHSIKAIAVRPDWIVNATPISTPTPLPSPTPGTASPGLISQGKSVTVSSIENDNLPGAAAVDGLLSTRWSSEYSDPQEIIIDLGETMTIGRIVLEWETAYAREYKLQISEDGETWTDIVHETNGNGAQDNHQVMARGRYIRMQGIKRATEWGYSLYEFWVFDTAEAPLPEIAPSQEVISTPDLRPDLIITSINWTPETIHSDSELEFSAVVENQGLAAALGTFQVDFTINNIVVGQGKNDRPLAPEASIVINSTQPWRPEQTGEFVLLAQVYVDTSKPSSSVMEINENNNMQVTYGIVEPDSGQVPEVTGTVTPISVTVSPAISNTPPLEATAGESLQNPGVNYQWIWVFAVLLLIAVVVIVIYLHQRNMQ